MGEMLEPLHFIMVKESAGFKIFIRQFFYSENNILASSHTFWPVRILFWLVRRFWLVRILQFTLTMTFPILFRSYSESFIFEYVVFIVS